MKLIQEFKLFSQLTLGDIGSWASLIGLAVTFFTARIVFTLKKDMIFKTSFDSHVLNIKNHYKEISALLQNYNGNSSEIEEIFVLLDVDLRAMQKGANSDLLNDVRNTRKLICKYNKKYNFLFFKTNGKNENTAREIKNSISAIAAESVHHKRTLLVGD